jgi:hypothetical protein
MQQGKNVGGVKWADEDQLLTKEDITQETADKCMLTLESLEASFAKGYVYAWHVEKHIYCLSEATLPEGITKHGNEWSTLDASIHKKAKMTAPHLGTKKKRKQHPWDEEEQEVKEPPAKKQKSGKEEIGYW